MCEEGTGGSAPKCSSSFNCSAGMGLRTAFCSYILPGAKGESGPDTQVIFSIIIMCQIH